MSRPELDFAAIEKDAKRREQADALMREIEREYVTAMREVLNTEAGRCVFARLLTEMGLFNDVYANNASVYKNAALVDFARAITETMDKIDLQLLIEIKKRLLDERKRLEALYGNK
jgi:hypothetical protein